MPHAPIDCPPTGHHDFDEADWSKLPNHMREGLHEYLRIGRPTGHFLAAVLANDLFGAVGHADPGSMGGLKATVHFIYASAPTGSYGSAKNIAVWMQHGGLVGLLAKRTSAADAPIGDMKEFNNADRVINAAGVVIKERGGDPDIIVDMRLPAGLRMTTRAERDSIAATVGEKSGG